MFYGRRRYQRRVAAPLGASTLGKIFIGEAFIRNCKLHDISHGGACLQVSDPQDIPDAFDLVLDAVATKKACRIVWRTRNKIGVAFGADSRSVAADRATA
jgi:hypothetical protein